MAAVLSLLTAVLFTGCGVSITLPSPGQDVETGPEDDIWVSDETKAANDGYAENINGQQTEPETEIIYVPQYITEYVTETVTPDSPVGYLKDHVTASGTLGVDYPFLSGYGSRDDYNGQISSYHRGMDFSMPVGTELTSPDNCLVCYTGYNDIRGNWIVLYWGSGYYIVYQHLSESFVMVGQMVQKGQVIALSGDTGASLMPHLHLEILQDDEGGNNMEDFEDVTKRVNPYYFVFGVRSQDGDLGGHVK